MTTTNKKNMAGDDWQKFYDIEGEGPNITYGHDCIDATTSGVEMNIDQIINRKPQISEEVEDKLRKCVAQMFVALNNEIGRIFFDEIVITKKDNIHDIIFMFSPRDEEEIKSDIIKDAKDLLSSAADTGLHGEGHEVLPDQEGKKMDYMVIRDSFRILFNNTKLSLSDLKGNRNFNSSMVKVYPFIDELLLILDGK